MIKDLVYSPISDPVCQNDLISPGIFPHLRGDLSCMFLWYHEKRPFKNCAVKTNI